ncbi:uncharacterized protein LMH87_008659 [Akanthomyces muscarius]|uniref:Uncharacterized protein n=1 Tax=Akanthomyces muscarius TaxID=2231603 RepID=A0A9W8QJ46_AKAMU|nr:uncharacterized protein LMH87_008659 [Akanthomyces muscarius]KAJ4158119.1 hypothetical protein LMH87_008659 [Akanthomyces muscarius]
MPTDFTAIANQAEADLNTYQAKTGAARAQGLDQAGINSMAEKKFEDRGAQVTQGDELSTNGSFNKRIPPSEGGVLDDKGRQSRGEQFDDTERSLDKLNQPSKHTATNDGDVVPARVPPVGGLGGQDDITTKGQKAQISNVGTNPSGPGGGVYKGKKYDTDSVPDPNSAEGYIQPESAVEASRETRQ